MPLASTVQGEDPNLDIGWGLSSLLGRDYDRKKQKLIRERQMEYNLFIAQQKELKTSEPRPQPQGFSLPSTEESTAQPGQVQSSDAAHLPSPASPLPTHRAHRDKKEVKAPVHDQNNNNWLWNADLRVPDIARNAARHSPATNQDKAEFATGLLIGATEEKAASQMRKEQYAQELLKQMAEKQMHKIREKQLQFRAVATGATGPEKKDFGAVNRRHVSRRPDVPDTPEADLEAEEKEPNPKLTRNKSENTELTRPLGKFLVDLRTALGQLARITEPGTGAAQGVPSQDSFNENYHRDLVNILGEVTRPRVAPIAPTVTNIYMTPYDAAYCYYGSRNPLDPNLPHHQNSVRGPVQQPGNLQSPPLIPSPRRASDQHGASTLVTGELREDKSKKKRENGLGLQEDLRRQIKEKEERVRREKEEELRYDARTEAYLCSTWGRSGGGDPIRDHKGNIISDLHQMHRVNVETYHNPVPKTRERSPSIGNGDTPGGEVRAPVSQQISGLGDTYFDDLKRQMEEDKRRREREKEKQRTQEEMDERRLQMERARLQEQYESEQKEAELKRLRQKGLIPEETSKPPTELGDTYREDLKRQMEEDKRRKEQEIERERIEEEKAERRLQMQRARMQLQYESRQMHSRQNEGEQNESEQNERKQSRLERKHQQNQRKEEKEVKQEQEMERAVPPSTRDREERPTPLGRKQRGPSPAVPSLQRKTNIAPKSVPVKTAPPQDRKDEVIRALSALRGHLRDEQTRLEAQLGQTGRQERSHTRTNRTSRRPIEGAAAHREAEQPDSSSREKVLHMFPVHRGNISPKRTQEHGDRDIYGGDVCGQQTHQLGSPQPSAEQQERTPRRRRHDIFTSHGERDIEPDVETPTSQNGEVKGRGHGQSSMRRRDSSAGVHNTNLERLSDDDEDFWSLCSAPERPASTETIATEPWLRPGTSRRHGARVQGRT